MVFLSLRLVPFLVLRVFVTGASVARTLTSRLPLGRFLRSCARYLASSPRPPKKLHAEWASRKDPLGERNPPTGPPHRTDQAHYLPSFGRCNRS